MPDTIYTALDPVDRAILDTVLYYDLLNYPLTWVELQQYLCPCGTQGLRIDQLRERAFALAAQGFLGTADDYIFLYGRGALVERRELDQAVDRRLWKRARTFFDRFRWVPFVRMVAVSGSLALNRSTAGSDIDIFIVAQEGRIWLVRALCVFIARIWGLYRSESQVAGRLCLNHFVTDEALTLDHQNQYTARLFSHLVPGYGLDVYHQFQRANLWVCGYVPSYPWDNYPPFEVRESRGPVSCFRRLGEMLLKGRIGRYLETAVKHYQLRRINRDERRFDERAQIVLSDQLLRFHLQAQEPVMLARFDSARAVMASAFTNSGTADTLETGNTKAEV